MNDNLKIYFETLFGNMPQQEWELLKGILEPLTILKGQYLHKIGEECKYLWFLEKGDKSV